MIIINGQEAYSGEERTCPFCGTGESEKMTDVNNQEGCPWCMAECELYGDIYPKDEMTEVLVKKYKGNEVIWRRGFICSEALMDEDFAEDWKPRPINVFEAIASCTKPLTENERNELGI